MDGGRWFFQSESIHACIQQSCTRKHVGGQVECKRPIFPLCGFLDSFDV
jgi:hypothetical protein